MSERESLPVLLFLFTLEKYTVCDVCGLRSPPFEPTTVLYITPTDNACMPELVLQPHKQKLWKICSRCKKNAKRVELKHFLQPLKYVIITVNIFTCMNNKIMLNRNCIPQDPNIMPGPYKFNLGATAEYNGHIMNCVHYVASVNSLGKPCIVSVLKLMKAILITNITNLLHIYYWTN